MKCSACFPRKLWKEKHRCFAVFSWQSDRLLMWVLVCLPIQTMGLWRGSLLLGSDNAAINTRGDFLATQTV